MPPLAEQHTRMQEFTAVFTVLRLLTALKMSYEVAKSRAQPYTKIVEELPEMRRDTVELVRRAVTANRKVYAMENNRAEENAPLTIEALANQLRAQRRCISVHLRRQFTGFLAQLMVGSDRANGLYGS